MVGKNEEFHDDDELVHMMNRNKTPLTRENYLDLAYGKEKPEEWGPELEDELPSRFRQPIQTED